VFSRSVGKRLAVGAATLATGFGLLLSIAPAASACPASTPWGPWNGLGYEQPTVVSGLPFHFHHCAPLAEQGPEFIGAVPAATSLVETRPQWRPAVRPAAEHGVRHRARRHHTRHHTRQHLRHHGRRFHYGRVNAARYGLGTTHRAVAPLSTRLNTRVTTPLTTRLVPAHAQSVRHPLAHRLGRHHGLRHHHRHHGLRHHRRHHHLHHRLNHS
jgi:hypothetical protein